MLVDKYSKDQRDFVAEVINRQLTRTKILGILTEDSLRTFESIAQDFSDTFELDSLDFDFDDFWYKCGLDGS